MVLFTDMPNVLEDYDQLLAALEPVGSCVVVEPPGTGGSWPSSSFDFSFEAFVATTLQVLEALGEPASVIMPCYLGHVGLEVARQHPALLRQLILPQVATVEALRAWVERVDPKSVLRTPVLGQAFLRIARGSIARRWYSASRGPDATDADVGAGAQEAFNFGGCWCLASVLQNFDVPTQSQAPPASVPTAVLWGPADRTYRDHAPVPVVEGASVELFEGCGHCPELEAPERFAGWMQARLEASCP